MSGLDQSIPRKGLEWREHVYLKFKTGFHKSHTQKGIGVFLSDPSPIIALPCPSLTSLVEFANFFEFVKVVKGSKKRIFYSQADRKGEGGSIFGI